MRKKKYAPILLISLYIIFTVVVSWIGPRKYFDYDVISVCAYMSAFLMCLWTGYLMREKICLVLRSTYGVQKILQKTRYERFAVISLHIALLTISLELICMVVEFDLSLNPSQMGNNYIKIRQLLDESGYNIGILIRFFTGIFRNISLILGFYYFFNLKKRYKFELVFYILLLVVVNVVGYGTQKLLGDIFAFFLVACFVKMMSWDTLKKIKIMSMCIILACVVVLVFAAVQNQRYAEIGVTAENYLERSDGTTYYDIDNFIFKIFGSGLGFGIGSVLGYVSGGYFGLSLSFRLPFVWTYGLGSSYILSLVFERFIGISIYDRTYLSRLSEFGRNGLSSWNTIFPWLASDYTFIGALLIFLFVGYFFAYVWYEVLYYRNPVSIVMFATLCLGFLYLPANNQLFHGIDGFIATVLTIFWWLWKHKKYNVMEQYEE